MCDQEIVLFGEKLESIREVIADVFCPSRYWARQKSVYVQTLKMNDESRYECPQCKACCQLSKNFVQGTKAGSYLFWRKW